MRRVGGTPRVDGEPLRLPYVISEDEETGRAIIVEYEYGDEPPLGLVLVALDPGEVDKFTWVASNGEAGRLGGQQVLQEGKYHETRAVENWLLRKNGLDVVFNDTPSLLDQSHDSVADYLRHFEPHLDTLCEVVGSKRYKKQHMERHSNNQICIDDFFNGIFRRCGGKGRTVLAFGDYSRAGNSSTKGHRHFAATRNMALTAERKHGAYVVFINERNTSLICSFCGAARRLVQDENADNPRRVLLCKEPACEEHPHRARDPNAALNILDLSAMMHVGEERPKQFRIVLPREIRVAVEAVAANESPDAMTVEPSSVASAPPSAGPAHLAPCAAPPSIHPSTPHRSTLAKRPPHAPPTPVRRRRAAHCAEVEAETVASPSASSSFSPAMHASTPTTPVPPALRRASGGRLLRSFPRYME